MRIYCVHNQITGKNYIGQTTRSLEERMYHHSHHSSSCRYLHRSIEKHGIDNFLIIQIDSAESLDQLYEKEKYWISKYESCDPSMGYNLRKAQKGSGSLSEDSKLVISKNTKNGMEKMSTEKKKERKEKSRKTQIDSGIYKRVAKERSVKYLGNKNHRAIRIYILDSARNKIEEFSTLKEFRDKHKIPNCTSIRLLKNGKPFKRTHLRGCFLTTPDTIKTLVRRK